MFDRTIWNIHCYSSYRTNNISEAYNKRLNGKISNPDPNLYKIIDVVKDEECLASVEYEKANLGKIKCRKTKNELKDANIEILKLKYIHDELDIMDFIIEVGAFIQEFD